MGDLTFSAIAARQGDRQKVFTIAATAREISQFASVSRIARTVDGELSGFQRHQIASHVSEIRDYLETPEALLPNSIVVAFTHGVSVKSANGQTTVRFATGKGPQGWVVDGQQRLTALLDIDDPKFQVFVSVLICDDEAELRRQFILINNTRPLPKSLIYELLPTVEALPERLSGRALAAELTARLNYDPKSSLRGMIHQHTNPEGMIRDTAVQRVIMQSLNDGIMRELIGAANGEDKCFKLISEFYRAVHATFPDEWDGHSPKTSRLVHGAGIAALGYVMETLALLDGARTAADFERGLATLKGRTAWTKGVWSFPGGDKRHWKAVQNVNRDVMLLSQHLISIVRDNIGGKPKKRAKAVKASKAQGKRARTAAKKRKQSKKAA